MELFERTASELSSMLKNKECSSVEIIESIYNRIDKVEDKVNSYITLCKETAIEKAKEVDNAIADGKELSSLAGQLQHAVAKYKLLSGRVNRSNYDEESIMDSEEEMYRDNESIISLDGDFGKY